MPVINFKIFVISIIYFSYISKISFSHWVVLVRRDMNRKNKQRIKAILNS